MLTLPPAAVSALAEFVRKNPPTPAEPPIPRITLCDEMGEGLLVLVPSSADPIHAVLTASNPSDWADVPDGRVDVSGFGCELVAS